MLTVEKVTVMRGKRVTLQDVSLSLPAGQTLAVVGESGAGKSTLIAAILGLLKPTAGQITWNGAPTRAVRPALVMQEPRAAFNPVLSLHRSIMEPVRAQGVTLGQGRLGLLGAGTWSVIFALSVTGWMRYARVAVGIGLSMQSRGYVVQARLAGMSGWSIARWHYLPSLIPSLTVVWTGMFARAILGISALGFLGFGVQPPNPEWGGMLLDARVHLRSTPLQMVWPGVAVVICVLAISLTGDALRDALSEPKSFE